MKKAMLRPLITAFIAVLLLALVSCQTPIPPVGGDEQASQEPGTAFETRPTEPTDAETEPQTDPETDPATDAETEPETEPIPEEIFAIKNLILIIGDGMGLDHIAAGELAYGKEYAFTDWDCVTVNTDSVNSNGYGAILTDSAAGGTALATGNLTVNGYIGKNHKGVDVETILDYAKSLGKATGVLSTDSLLGATPASFSAHSLSRGNTAEIANSQIYSGVDLLGGAKDGVCASLVSKITAQGYYYVDEFNDIDRAVRKDKTYWQFDMAGTAARYQLETVTYDALKMLSRNDNGFVLILEQAYIDKYSHSNDFANTVHSVNSLNNTVEVILEWIGDRTDTAVLITADHETGGLVVSANSGAYNKTHTAADGSVISYNWSSTNHTRSKVGLFTYGITTPDYSKFSYYGSDFTIKNSDVYHLMKDILDNPVAYNPYN